jgi:hypothetical protein
MDRRKDEPIIDLTEVVEEAPGPVSNGWAEAEAPAPSLEKKTPEPPKLPKREIPPLAEDLKGIPESPLKKFLLAEDEPSFAPIPPPAGKPLGFSSPTPPPPQISPEPARPSPETHRPTPEGKAAAPESPKLPPEPPRPAFPNMEAEMRAMREAMLSRVEKWVAQEGVQVLERVAKEIFPKVAEEIIRKEIEKVKAEAEEK